MAKKIFVTHPIPDRGLNMLKEKGYEVTVNPREAVLEKSAFISALQGRGYDAVLSLLTDKIDATIFDAAGKSVKIFANYAVGFDNVDLAEAKKRGVMITNTPGVLTESVAELTFALMLALGRRIVEADTFMRAGRYAGWTPSLLLGDDVANRTLGILGLGKIGTQVAKHAVKGFDMKVFYYDPNRNADFEKEYGAEYCSTVEDLLPKCDFVSIHVPLLPATTHLINEKTLRLMKPSAYLINTSRGPVVDEHALALALQEGVIKGAALDVFEHEPTMDPFLKNLPNVIVTPHIASATVETRQRMSEIAATNIIAALEGATPPNLIS